MSSDSRVCTSAQSRQYLGNPYVNPPELGVPTEDPYAATQWADLPKRPIGTAVRFQEGVQKQAATSSSLSNQVEGDCESNPVAVESKQDIEDNPIVYIDIPDSIDNSICEARNHTNQINEKSPEEISYISDDEPVLYIDLPQPEESDMFERTVDINTPNSRRQNQAKTNDEEEPVVYIEIPECSGSGVSERRPEVDDEPSTSVVQETIFYDQFKDRRIDVIPENSRDSDTDNSSSNNSTIRRPSGISISAHRQRQRPSSLNLWSLFTSLPTAEASTSPGSSTPSQAYLIPQGYQEPYRNTPDDGFNLPPLPVTEFWDPPPAYTEIDFASPSGNPVPARTSTVLHKAHPVPYAASPVSQVSTPVTSLGNPGSIPGTTDQPRRTSDNEDIGLDRQSLECQRCRVTVQSIVVREPSFRTHLAAICFFIIGCLPCTIAVYASDWCKTKIHYCPNCSKKISKT